jgi:uncharacterized protein (TIGR03435 family)
MRQIEWHREKARDDFVMGRTSSARVFTWVPSPVRDLSSGTCIRFLTRGLPRWNSPLIDCAESLLACRGRGCARLFLANLGMSVFVLPVLLLASSLLPDWIALAQSRTNPAQSGAYQARPVAFSSPRFEVASIRPQKPGRFVEVELTNHRNDGQFYASGVTAMVLLQVAYGLRRFQILGAPSWVTSARFNIEAKSDDAVNNYLRHISPAQGLLAKQRMLQALLVDRFKLKHHRETRDLPVYALIVAKHGPKLRESNDAGSNSNEGENAGGQHRPRLLVFVGRDMELHLSSKDMSMSSLVDFLQGQVERTIVDTTGLKGKYDVEFKCGQNVSLIYRGGGSAGSGGGLPSTEGFSPSFPGPSIFSAVKDQLGLELKPERRPLGVLVIDDVQLPTPN